MNHVARALLLAPLVLACHVLEESPGFVAWFNSHVSRGITPGLFWRVNITALIVTVAVVVIEWFWRSGLSLSLALTWLSFLMLANSVLHVAGGIVDGRYVPGLATAVLLYLPYYAWLFMRAVRSQRVEAAGLVAAAVLGSLPMLIHGYLILFRGSRLF
ncbi:MAG: HXXEE domain-containing protein [Acidobacteriota bacterium]|nr:HXXEE domain-containing protein [Acidobacteriota bacterium]